jgi:hypothetical protein
MGEVIYMFEEKSSCIHCKGVQNSESHLCPECFIDESHLQEFLKEKEEKLAALEELPYFGGERKPEVTDLINERKRAISLLKDMLSTYQ